MNFFFFLVDPQMTELTGLKDTEIFLHNQLSSVLFGCTINSYTVGGDPKSVFWETPNRTKEGREAAEFILSLFTLT